MRCATASPGHDAAHRHRRGLRPDRGGRRHQRACRGAFLSRSRERRARILSSTITTISAATPSATNSTSAADMDLHQWRHAGDRQSASLQRGGRRADEGPRHRRRAARRSRPSIRSSTTGSACSAACSSTGRPSAPTSWWSASSRTPIWRVACGRRRCRRARAPQIAQDRDRRASITLPGLTSDEKKDRLSAHHLRGVICATWCKADPARSRFYQPAPTG